MTAGMQAAADWSPFRRQRAAEQLRALAARKRLIDSYAHPAQVMAACNPDYVITPAVELVSRKIEQVLRSRRRRLMISAPPQEFKSMLCAVTTPIRALQLHPNWRVMLLTYADGLAEEHSRTARELILQHGGGVVDSLTGQPLPDRLGISLHPSVATASNWRIAEGGGGLVAAGRDATVTGKRADLLIVDDPFKNMQEADSHAMRTKIIEWFHSVASTRLSAGASVIIIQCMTGDTPVLRPDGSETPLRDIRPGDEIATYDNGALSTSIVRNWTSQGYDDVLCIRMMSGRTVRANARHPFLTSEGVWKRAGQITSGDRLVALSEGHGKPGRPAPSMNASPPQCARGCADRTTRSSDGLTVSGTPRGAVDSGETSSCASGTASTTTNTIESSPPRTAGALSADDFPQTVGCPSTGTGISASITATIPKLCEDCSATTATSCSGVEAPPSVFAPGRSISTDTVVSVEPAGRAEVFDIQVDRTENFIANGLVSHNTRWHPEDLCGTLLAHDRALPPELREWHYINIPAISHPAIPDALGREPGIPLESARGRTKADFEKIERSVGKRVWNALYQGSPTPPEGGLFSQAWFDAHRLAEMPDRTRVRIVAVDPAESGEGDEAGVIGAALFYPPAALTQAVTQLMADPDASLDIWPQVALTHDRSAQMTSQQWATAAVDLALETDASHIFIETYTAGTTYVNVVKTEITKRTLKTLGSPSYEPDPVRRAALVQLLHRVHGWRGTGDAVARSGLLRQAVEVGTCVVLGHEMAELENQAVNWTIGRHQPDRVAAAVIAHDRLMTMLGKQAQIAAPIGSPGGRNSWLSRKVG